MGRTKALGLALAPALPPQAIVLLSGEMGAGKTTLIKAICEGLGVSPRLVISPTYTLVNVYPGTPNVYHVDLFRIEQPEALLELDRDDWINPEGPTLIEWPDKALPLLARDATLDLSLQAVAGAPQTREVRARGAEGPYGAVFRALRAFLEQ
ncbi:MAG: tRNA (adenosine(37)-N6)-threonylcarbamoyltransferase complex ATPase subunit type 1 TsaE [Deltaproteobacteria bacterium]|nr:tRNA (adenosine(37)-N6)-threonylcarbamoyltransferase complex ATPase subunit type 1 TsaE [Deltaproteobacteria bacterium]